MGFFFGARFALARSGLLVLAHADKSCQCTWADLESAQFNRIQPTPSSNKKKKKKKIGKCEGCRIQNVTFCHPHVSCYCGSPSVTWKGNIVHTRRAAHVHTTSRWGRGKWLIIPSASVHAVKQCQGIARTSLLPERRQSAAALRLKTLSKQAEIAFYCSAPTLRFGSFTVKWKKIHIFFVPLASSQRFSGVSSTCVCENAPYRPGLVRKKNPSVKKI